MKRKVIVTAINDLLQTPEGLELLADFPRTLVIAHLRKITEESRSKQLLEGAIPKTNQEILNEARVKLVNDHQPTLKKVINGTGTILHTNLGRSNLAPCIKEELFHVAFGFSNVEYVLETGERGSRYAHLEKLLQKLTGAEAALVVNNNAAAVLLTLSALAKGKEVVVSRGELVEIGGSFRIPEIMELSGCHLKEIGTTNKTHKKDYLQATEEEFDGLILKVHTSNYSIKGFTAEVDLKDLKEIASTRNIPLVYDMGSGVLTSLGNYGVETGYTVKEVLSTGVDIVTFSGDKLLGGPQAGIIVGKKEYIEKMKEHQLTRALRIDKMTIAALEGTLRLYLDETKAISSIPTLNMLTLSKEELHRKAICLMKSLFRLEGLQVKLIEGISQVGGGSMPDVELSSWLLALEPEKLSTTSFVEALRKASIPIILRIKKEQCLLDIRTVNETDFPIVINMIRETLESYR